VSESFPTSILAGLPIVAETADAVLADATDFLLRDNGVASALKEARQGSGARMPRARRSARPDRRLPRNTEIEPSSRSPPTIRRKPSVLPTGTHDAAAPPHFLKLPDPVHAATT
jgi:hypothetical protein